MWERQGTGPSPVRQLWERRPHRGSMQVAHEAVVREILSPLLQKRASFVQLSGKV